MTGRDLIVYILQNNLEDKPIFIDEGFMNMLNEVQAAAKFNVGVETIRVWFSFGALDGVKIGDMIYISPNSKSPMEAPKPLVKLC